ncbi:MAG: NAD(P)/FAD-dependent oxidoreductase, partial [Candidatus Gracilibacteria bacterium]|nr:NAD(P)/FAD-dependent oxidoreductase [Candidatus Gracilibacteria bacterium]
MQTHYDIIIIGAGAAGLFASINAPKNKTKLILEKNKNPGVKVLLSGGERANVSNIDIETSRDYFGQNKKALISLFKRFNNFDIISFFAENGINIVEEDRGRLILESGDSKELLNLLIKKSKENNSKIECNKEVVNVEKPHQSPLSGGNSEPNFSYDNGKLGRFFSLKTQDGTRYTCEKLVITTGGKSFFQVGTTGDGYIWATNFGHTILTPHRGLCLLVRKKDLSEISGVSCDLKLEVISNIAKKN